MPRSSTPVASALSVLAAGAALGIAVGSERWAGLVPCALCLLERWPYRVAIVLGILAACLPLSAARPVLALVVLVILADAALAVVHVGVEAHAWPSPLPECAAPRLSGTTVAGRLAELPDRPAKPCDAPTWLIPGLPLSMAAMNLVYAAVFAALLAGFLWRTRARGR